MKRYNEDYHRCEMEESEEGEWVKFEDVDFIESMKVLKLESGDVIVLKTDRVLGDVKRGFVEAMDNFFKGINIKNKVVLLEGGMDIGVLRKE